MRLHLTACVLALALLAGVGCSSATPTLAPPTQVAITPSAELAAAIAQAKADLNAGDAAAAIARLEPAVAGGQGTSEAHFLLGNAYADQDNLTQAEANYRLALTLDPANVDAQANLGVVLYRNQQLAEAETAFRTALELAPDDAEIHYNLGGVLAAQSKLDAAVQEFQRANELAPKLAEPYLGLGSVYQLQDKKDEAIAALNRYLELSDDPTWRAHAEQMLADLGAGK